MAQHTNEVFENVIFVVLFHVHADGTKDLPLNWERHEKTSVI